MLRQIKYFQAVVRNHSFSEAAEECHISQSAISQQIKAMETELGFQLFERKSRKFTLTPAGKYFYKKSLILIADYEQLCNEALKLAHSDKEILKIGYLRSYGSQEIRYALEDFSEQYPHVSVQLLNGNHEDLFLLLRNNGADLVLNDQRRAFSDEYVNMVLSTNNLYIELSSKNPLSELPCITTPELKNIPCILVASKKQWKTEQEYYQTVIGFQGEFLYAENLDEARLLVVSGQGFIPLEGNGQTTLPDVSIRHIPLFYGGVPILKNYCAFWKKSNANNYIEKFAEILKSKFV